MDWTSGTTPEELAESVEEASDEELVDWLHTISAEAEDVTEDTLDTTVVGILTRKAMVAFELRDRGYAIEGPLGDVTVSDLDD